MKYLTAKQAVGKLRQGKVTDISEAYFSQLVTAGAIPFHIIPGKKRKLYLYDEVKQALADIRDPARDPQREAIARRKQLREKADRDEKRKIDKKKLDACYQEAKERCSLFESMAFDEYKKSFNVPQEEWEGSTIEECYRLDMEVTKENRIVLELIDWYMEAVQSEKPTSLEELDFVIKKVLVHSLLSKDFYTLC